MAEDWVKDACSEARAAFDALFEVEVELGALKENQSKLAEQLNEAVRAKDSSEADLKTTEKQAEDLRKQLHYTEINLAIEKQLVIELREELRKAREAVQLVKEATEAEKQAAYILGVRRLKPDSQRNSPLYARSTVVSLGVKPLMLLGSLWALT